MNHLYKLLSTIRSLLFDTLSPAICVNCRSVSENKEGLCATCLGSVTVNDTAICSTCRARLPENKKICHKNSAYLLAAATNYSNDVARNIIWQYKYRHKPWLAKQSGKILAQFLEKSNLQSVIDSNAIISPMPLHKKRERKRGFNQSLLLAQELSQLLKLPIHNTLMRVKDTPRQAEISDYDRRRDNIAGCFVLDKGIAPTIKGRQIILVDDVTTSGATLNEAARALKTAGARKIIGLVIAKA
ncbi:MAG: ComF family protein [bacterium]|nr:ComF family protein [bacterium]